MGNFDNYDCKILNALQTDASQSLDHLADLIGLSRNACWRRVKALEGAGVIKGRVALLDPERVDLSLMVFMQVRTNQHDRDWHNTFAKTCQSISGILSVYRMSGDLDYLIRARVKDMKDYDRLYQQLINRQPIADISASFVMEELKETTILPV